MALDDRTRHDRLRSLLPRSFASDPHESALGVVLEVLADMLRDSDRVIERALRDKWLRTASGTRGTSARISVVAPPGWVVGSELSKALREQVVSDAAAIDLEVGELIARTTLDDRSMRPALGMLGPLPLDVCITLGEFATPFVAGELVTLESAVQALVTRLAPLGLPLGHLASGPGFVRPRAAERTTHASARLFWARWEFGGEALELALLPAPTPMVAWLRGPADARGYRNAADLVLASLDFPLPLELLGDALSLRRQAWEHDHDAYRSRVRILGPLLAEGLATPRVILAFALTSLGAEPCPVLERPDHDTTRAHGLPPRSLDRCRACKGGKRAPADGICPLRNRSIMQALVTDNPRTRAQLTRSRQPPASAADSDPGRLRIRSDSLFSARPELVLGVPGDAPPDTKLVPRFVSETTGEEIVLPTLLRPGEQLTIRPPSPHDPSAPRHEQVWVDPPPGEAQRPSRAWIRREVDGKVELEQLGEVSLFAHGQRFDQARFSDQQGAPLGTSSDPTKRPARFSEISVGPLTPEVVPGINDWVYRPLSGAELFALLGDYGELGVALRDAQPELDFPAATTPVALALRWWTRPPARFRLQIPRKPAVDVVLAQGAADYLRAMIERVRPAGIQAILDFALEPFTDTLEPDDRFAALDVLGRELAEPEATLQTASSMTVEQAEPDEQVGFLGIFDVTRFDFSRFGDKAPVPGRFNLVEFEWGLFSVLGPAEAATLDATFFDHAFLSDGD